MSDTTFDKTDRSPDNGNMKAKWIALGVIVALILGVAISSTDSDLFQGLIKRKAKSGLTNQRSAINLPTKPSLNLDSSSSGPSTANTAPQDSTTPPPPPALTANTSRNEGVVSTRYALGQREARIASFWVTNAGDRETEDIIVSSIKLQRKGSTMAPEITNFKLSLANVNAVGNRTGTETIIGTVTNSADDRSITWTGVDTVIKPKMGGVFLLSQRT